MKKNERLKGLNFICEDNLNRFKNRTELKRYISQKGGSLNKEINEDTDYLIISDYSKKNNHFIPTLTEDQFVKMAEPEMKDLEVSQWKRIFKFDCTKDNKLYITGYKSKLKDVIIPDKIGDKEVVGINSYAFKNCHFITSIYMSDSINYIEPNAFYDCHSLENIKLSPNVETIFSDTFFLNFGLKELVIPNGVKKLEYRSINGLVELETLYLPESLIEIEGGALHGLHELKEIIIDENNPVYDSRDNCCGIIETATSTLIAGTLNTKFPISLKAIGSNTFYDLEFFKKIVVPKNVEFIGYNAFKNLTYLSSNISFDLDTVVFENENIIFETAEDYYSRKKK